MASLSLACNDALHSASPEHTAVDPPPIIPPLRCTHASRSTTSTQARTLGVGRGVLVLGVPVNSRAAAAGLRPTVRRADGSISLGDVIIAIDETAVCAAAPAATHA